MDANELVTAYSLTDPALAEIIKDALHAEGIACELGGEGQMGLTGILSIDVLVRAADEDRARKIIERHEK